MRNTPVHNVLMILLALSGCATDPVPPTAGSGAMRSGLQVGDDIVPWNPIHVAGPNAGTNACPVCTYEARPAVVIFTKDNADLRPLATQLQALVVREQKHELKGFVIVLDSTPAKLKDLAAELKITSIGLCYPDPQTREHDLQEYKIDADAGNTVMVYRGYKVTANFVNLPAVEFGKLDAAVRATVGPSTVVK